MLIQNKTAIFLGDSITEGAGASKIDNAYWNVLKRNIGLKQVIFVLL